ncbi:MULTISPECIES: Lrp/AsnC family transcriptional regulator [unclassified Moraxella]|uniref:Lrp/AsnC family transcriptional regulator n=1 Tax=unclassified Moraxella TaxID=2685852 RepID=UPI00359DB1AF
MNHTLDDTDKVILNLLQDDATTPLKIIAEHARISIATAQRRINTLIEQQVIDRQVAIINPLKVGYGLTVLVMIKMATSNVSMQQRFERIMSAEPQVMMCYEISGNYDFMLVVNSQNMQDYHAFTRRLLTSENNVNHFNSQFVMNFIKSGTKITLK